MSAVTIYHNPRCSKSRNTLALLEENGVTPDVVLYLETPPDASQLQALLKKLGMQAGELLRRGEADYKEAGLDKNSSDADVLRLYEVWMRTGSKRARRRLRRLGIEPLDAGQRDFRH